MVSEEAKIHASKGKNISVLANFMDNGCSFAQ